MMKLLPPWWEFIKVLFMRWHMIQAGQLTQLIIQHHWGGIQDKLVQPVVHNVHRLIMLIAPDVVFVQHVVQLCPVLLLRLQLLQQIAVVVLIQQRWEVEHYLFKELTNLCTREIYRISSYSFRPWIVSAPLCTVTFGLMYCDLWNSKFKKE